MPTDKRAKRGGKWLSTKQIGQTTGRMEVDDFNVPNASGLPLPTDWHNRP